MPDGPIRTREWRVNQAIHLYYSKGRSQSEIGDELGVSQQAVSQYIHEKPGEETREQLTDQAVETRRIAWEDLTTQLREAGRRTDNPRTPVEVWTDENGEVEVAEIRDDTGQVIDRKPVPRGYEMGPDTQEEFYGRNEKREVLELLAEITGASAPEQLEITGPDGSPLVVMNRDDDNEDRK